MMMKAFHWSVASLMALHAAREALIHEGRTRISVIGVRGMIWMPKVYSAFSPNHVPRSTFRAHRQPTTPLLEKSGG